MATLVFTAIGSAIGGPVGSAIGALIGQAVDARLFAPKGRSGPRLSDLKVQTSSYGTAVPRLYGRMRVAGTVIWSTDLIEHRSRQSTGKGRPKVTTFSYTASFAVALSSRPIDGVGRIWAEGSLLRGAAGDFKSDTGFRLYTGDADQATDPLISAAVGPDACPAYRGMSYAVFEDMDLSPFGNRIPSLTFEVIADAGAIDAATPLDDLLSPVERPPSLNAPLHGAIISDGSVGDGIAPLLRILPLHRAPGVERWQAGADTLPAPLPIIEPANDEKGARQTRRRPATGATPSHITLNCYDPARDYQIAVHQARVPGGAGGAIGNALPVALSADDGKALVARMAQQAALADPSILYPCGFQALAAYPGRAVRADAAVMLVEEREIKGATVTLTLMPPEPALSAATGDSGAVVSSADLLMGASHAALFDVPVAQAGVASRLLLAATGSGAGWRGAAVSIRAGTDGPFVDHSAIGPVAILGRVSAIDIRTVNSGEVIDTASTITVTLVHADMALSNASDADLIGGANLALIGGEMLQYGLADPLGGGQWRLSRLLRGRLGTEDRIPALTIGADFTLANDPAMIDLPDTSGLAAITAGGAVRIEGPADDAPLTLSILTSGRAGRPLSPVQLRAAWRDDGGLDIGWIGRSRLALDWPDLRDAAPDERAERWQISLTAGTTSIAYETTSAALTLSTAEVASLRSAAGMGGALTLSLVQIGDLGISPPALLTLSLSV